MARVVFLRGGYKSCAGRVWQLVFITFGLEDLSIRRTFGAWRRPFHYTLTYTETIIRHLDFLPRSYL